MTRRNRYKDGTVIQQAMIMDQHAMVTEGGMPSHVLGVVLEVYPSDNPRNRTSFQRDDHRGYLHEAAVLVVMDGTDSMMRLDNVVICPDHGTGLDNYFERLPRPTTSTVTGEAFNGRMNGVNPYELDGDWCVVSFLGGSIRHPFISRWWPHGSNTYDPMTSGLGNPDDRGRPQALDQRGRYFQRVNGIEYLVTNDGDIYLSTRWANSVVKNENTAVEGRYSREESESGGTISVNIKPTQRLVLDFNPEVEGLHHLSGFDDQLPQTNPRTSRSPETREDEDSRLVVTREEFRLSTTRAAVLASESATIDADEEIELATDTVNVDADTINLGVTAPEALIMGETFDSSTSSIVTAFATTMTTLKAAITASGLSGTQSTAINAGLDGLYLLIQQLQQQIGSSLTTKTKAE